MSVRLQSLPKTQAKGMWPVRFQVKLAPHCTFLDKGKSLVNQMGGETAVLGLSIGGNMLEAHIFSGIALQGPPDHLIT